MKAEIRFSTPIATMSNAGKYKHSPPFSKGGQGGGFYTVAYLYQSEHIYENSFSLDFLNKGEKSPFPSIY
jgi:hypothetical protein